MMNMALQHGIIAPRLRAKLERWCQDRRGATEEMLTFLFAMLAIVPLAERLGWTVEQMLPHVGFLVAGLLNVTFANGLPIEPTA